MAKSHAIKNSNSPSVHESNSIGAREREQKRLEEEALKQDRIAKGLQALKPAPVSKPKGEVKKSLFNNPEAKFVPSLRLEARHLLYSERHVGEVFTFPEKVVKQLENLGMINEKWGFQYLRDPICLIRHNTGLVARELFAQKEGLGTGERRVIVAGKGGSGKSFILLQMAALGLMQDYVVVAVPRGILRKKLS